MGLNLDNSEFQPPPDLTPHLVRIKNQYSAGGSFGDVYKCRYLAGSVQKEVRILYDSLLPRTHLSLGCSKGFPIQLHNRRR